MRLDNLNNKIIITEIPEKNTPMEPVNAKDDSQKSNEKFKDNPEKGEICGEDDDDDGVEEDVPGDFFDDFLKEDFMAGLDIVDEDEGEEDKQHSGKDGNSMSFKKGKKKSLAKERRNKLKKEKKKNDENGEFRRHRKNTSEDRKTNKRSSREGIINADEFDIRRDPKKTKRDIERDKAKCEKDKEKKIITEKLKLVETGLVPPGMEMEMDIEEVKKKKEEMDQQEKSIKLSQSRSPRKRSRSKEKIKKSPLINLSPRRRISPRRISPRRISSRRSPRRSPRRASPRRSPIRRRSIERISLRRSRSISPYYRNRRNRYSPIRPRASPDRDSYSRHRRSRSRSAKRRREEKKSFLQEIAEKLNETRPAIQMMPLQHLQPAPTSTPEMYNINMQPLAQLSHPSPVPAPAPVPPPIIAPVVPPQFNPHVQTQYDPYDQNFFIGTPQPSPVLNYGGPQTRPAENLSHLPLQVNTLQKPLEPPKPVFPLQTSNSKNFNRLSQGIARRLESKEDIAKLFQDSKITLSEFLAITAKPEVCADSPAHIQEKIKVISRCQDAIKILGNSEKKFTGPLIIRKSKKSTLPQDKLKSPLVKFSQLKIPFTDMPKKDQHKSAFTNYINHLLQSIGLMNEAVVDVDDQDGSSSVGTAVRLEETSPPPPPPLISHNKNINQNDISAMIPPNLTRLSNNQLSKFVQTEVWKCQECERRNKIFYKSSGVQCGGEGVTFSVSTQVTESDFLVKIPKSQSLASLTPAQLLAKSGSKFSRNVDVDDFDLSFPSKHTRTNFRPGSELYGVSRYSNPSPPPRFLPSNRDDLGFNQIPSSFGGRGRGNQTHSSFSNNYY